MPEREPTSRATFATVVATAAVTVAVGVTAAALGGYIVPARDLQALAAEAPGSQASPDTHAPPSNANPSAPSVVFVPVAPDAPAAGGGADEPEWMVADYEVPTHEERHGSARYRHDEDEEEDEDHHDDE